MWRKFLIFDLVSGPSRHKEELPGHMVKLKNAKIESSMFSIAYKNPTAREGRQSVFKKVGRDIPGQNFEGLPGPPLGAIVSHRGASKLKIGPQPSKRPDDQRYIRKQKAFELARSINPIITRKDFDKAIDLEHIKQRIQNKYFYKRTICYRKERDKNNNPIPMKPIKHLDRQVLYSNVIEWANNFKGKAND